MSIYQYTSVHVADTTKVQLKIIVGQKLRTKSNHVVYFRQKLEMR